VLNFLLLLQFLITPIPAPSATQVQELILKRSFTLGYPMPVPDAKLLAEAVIEESGSIALPMILATIEIESKYERRAKSKKKCKGVMQLSPGTAKTMAQRLGMSKFDVFNIKTNVKLGVNYLAALLEENGSIGLALTVYNRGWKLFVYHNKKMSKYAVAVVHRARLIKKLLKNDLTCEK
jgi:hypothetical protein